MRKYEVTCFHANHCLERILFFCLILTIAVPRAFSAGEFWHELNNGLTLASARVLVVVPQNPSTMYLGTDRGLYKSTDGGANWRWVNYPFGGVYAVAIDPINPAIVYATGSQPGSQAVFKSVDGGEHWTLPTSGMSGGPDLKALAVSPRDTRIIYAGSEGWGIYKSTTGGATWSTVNGGITADFMNVCSLAIDPFNTDVIYAGIGQAGIYKSLDGGGNWNFAGSGLSSNYVQSIVIAPINPSTLYVGTMYGGVYKSTDGGNSWNSATNGISYTDIRSLAIDPRNPATLYAGTNGGGVFKSTDGGATWSSLNVGLTNLRIYALTTHPTIPQKLYAGTYGSGVWAYPSPYSSVSVAINREGAASAKTTGFSANDTAKVGYATLAVNSGGIPYGTAVFSYKQNGVTISEAAVPASLPTTRAGIFIDYRSYVDAVPGRPEAGKIDVNTGIAVVNCGSQDASVTYALRTSNGGLITSGTGTIAAGHHFAKFIDQFKDVAAGFALPANFQAAIQFASLEVSSTQPLSITALRMTTNQRYNVLFTTTPVADLTQSRTGDPIYFAQFADGGGYTSTLILLNTSDGTETGTLQILDNQGAPVLVNRVGGATDSSFNYSIPGGGIYIFRTDGSPSQAHVGWVKLTPDGGRATPVGSGLFAYNPGTVLLSESGIPAAVSTTHARVYVDLSGNHNTGLAIANGGTARALISINAFREDGFSPVGNSTGPLQLAGNGHDAKFADQLVSGLPAGF
ncbi:MAG TPA: hypothetical protein VE398_23440 [Acidobacteriota bacterium]|nr:hypothetical protein [Acidobacteriota bacterium]